MTLAKVREMVAGLMSGHNKMMAAFFGLIFCLSLVASGLSERGEISVRGVGFSFAIAVLTAFLAARLARKY